MNRNNTTIISENFKTKAAAWIMAKGLGVTVLVCWCANLTYDNRALNRSITQLQQQMFELQSTVIKDNTKTISEFNLLNKSK